MDLILRPRSSKQSSSSPIASPTALPPAPPSPVTQAHEPERVFNKFDINGDGKISSSELSAVFESLDHLATPDELAAMMMEADTDDDFISLADFIDLNTSRVDPAVVMEDPRHSLSIFDRDQNRSIVAEELASLLQGIGEGVTAVQCRKMIRGVDQDGDGVVSFEEFRIMMTRGGSALASPVVTRSVDADSTVLACVAFSCPNLESFEISVAENATNRITGDELSRFVAEKRSLSILKVEGCTNLGSLNLCSSTLSTLWLSDLYCISKSVINCPNLKELSLDFTRQENDSTDLITMMDSLGRTCPRLRNIHVASIHLCNESVLALAGANLRGLRMLSLVLGSKITDASVAALVSCYTSLELLDLSGSNISDSGIGMICNAFSQTLSRLLLALCPNITSSGIQFAAAQLPFLQLIDCGMSIQDSDSQTGSMEGIGELDRCSKVPKTASHVVNQKLIIKHGRLKKLSLWGCSGLDGLYLNCLELNDLNLNSCTNLHPERLLLQCPNLKTVHAAGCQDMLVGAIRNQVLNEFASVENLHRYKRSADGSKRVHVPYSLEQPSAGHKHGKRQRSSPCSVHVD